MLHGNDAMLLSERLRVTLAQEIATGALPGGALLDEQVIATRFGISRTPVREALRQLAAIEMIELRPRRGAVVKAVTQARMMAMFEATAEIEATCARLATYRMTMAQRVTMQQIHREAKNRKVDGDYEGYVTLNQELHDLIYQATHNEVLIEQATALRFRLGEFRNAQLRGEARVALSNDEHGAILDAMSQGDGVAAERLMRAHLLNAASAFQAMLTEAQAREEKKHQTVRDAGFPAINEDR